MIDSDDDDDNADSQSTQLQRAMHTVNCGLTDYQ